MTLSLDALADRIDAFEQRDHDEAIRRARELMVALVNELPWTTPWLRAQRDDLLASPGDAARRAALTRAAKSEVDRSHDAVILPLDQAPRAYDLEDVRREVGAANYVMLAVQNEAGKSAWELVEELMQVLPAAALSRVEELAAIHFPEG